jgi:hypothetical protein
MTTIINIGLNNNPYDVVDIISLLNQLFGDTPIVFSIDDGIYNGAIEPTLAIAYDDSIDNTTIETICLLLTQTCIAVKRDGIGELVYVPDYTGEKYIFDEQFFITPKYNNDELTK